MYELTLDEMKYQDPLRYDEFMVEAHMDDEPVGEDGCDDI